MCSPVAAGMGMLAGGSSALQIAGARQAGRANNAYADQQQEALNEDYRRQVDYQQRLGAFQNQQYQQTTQSALGNLAFQTTGALTQASQVDRATSVQLRQIQRNYTQAQSLQKQTAAESGTTGQSLNALMMHIDADRLQNEQAVAQSRDATQNNIFNQIQGMYSQTQDLINQAMPAPMAPIGLPQQVQRQRLPGYLPAFFSGASAGLSAAQQQGMFDYTGDP
jgi:hypothetical protein